MRVTGWTVLVAVALLLAPAGAGEKAKLAPAKLVGTWTYVSGEKDGKKITADELKAGVVEITKKNITLNSPDGKFIIKYEIDPAKKPARIKMEITEGPQGQGSKTEGIIRMKGDQLQLCYPALGGAVPTEFAAKAGSGLHLFTLARKK